MRKLFAFCLLVLMSLQLSWSAVGQYCEHEIGQSARHFGHHAHQHANSADDARSDKTQPSKGPHADCGLCYAGTSLMGAGELQASFLDVANVHSTTFSTPLTDSPPSRPERPKWVKHT